MNEWICCGENIAVGDVVRWVEADWQSKGKRKKPLKLGERKVVGQVVAQDESGLVSVLVMQCEVLKQIAVRPVKVLKEGETIKRKRATIGRGSGERLKWSEESARAAEVSKFL